jgi:arginase family enzyme
MTRRAPTKKREVRRATPAKPRTRPDAASRHAREAQSAQKPPRSESAQAAPARPRHARFRPPPLGAPRAPAIASFLRLPIHDDPSSIPEVDVLLVGVASDAGASFRPGARFGPRAVREASIFASPFSAALGIDVFDEVAAADGGDVRLATRGVEVVIEAVAVHTQKIAASGVIPGFIGGDRTVTLGALRGLRRSKHRALNALFISAHPGASSSVEELRAANFLRFAVSEGLVRTDSVMQVGLRGPYAGPDELAFAFSHGIQTVGIDEVRWDLHAVVSQVRKLVQKGALYVSIDLGVLDPAHAPGVGFPVPGGMTTWDLQQILRALVGAELAGFDVLEIAPDYDPSGITALAGISVLQELLAGLADTRRSARPAPSTHKSGRAGRRSA